MKEVLATFLMLPFLLIGYICDLSQNLCREICYKIREFICGY